MHADTGDRKRHKRRFFERATLARHTQIHQGNFGDFTMEKIIINGGLPLNGDVYIDGMKNAALPIIAATLLCRDTCIIENVPAVSDIAMLLDIIKGMGARVEYLDKTVVSINAANVQPGSSPYDLVCKIRGSAYIIGAEIGRFGTAHVGYPGGCQLRCDKV